MSDNTINFENRKNQHQRFVESMAPENWGGYSENYQSQRTSSRNYSRRNIRYSSTRNQLNYKAEKGTKKKLLGKVAAIALAATIIGGGVSQCISNNNSADENRDTNIEELTALNFTGISEENIQNFEALKADIDSYYADDTQRDSISAKHTDIKNEIETLSLSILHEKIANALGIEPSQVSVSVGQSREYTIHYTNQQGEPKTISSQPTILYNTLINLENLQMHKPVSINSDVKNLSDFLEKLMAAELTVDNNGKLIEIDVQSKDLSEDGFER